MREYTRRRVVIAVTILVSVLGVLALLAIAPIALFLWAAAAALAGQVSPAFAFVLIVLPFLAMAITVRNWG